MAAKKTATKQASSSQSAGKGKKHCPSCKEIIAARSSTCPFCSFVIPPKDKKAPSDGPKIAGQPKSIDEKAFIRVCAGKGFKFVRLVNELTGELVKDERDPKIDKLALKFAGIPSNCDGIYITQTSPQIQVSMSFDKFLEIAGIKP
jgi:hypothetical protein